MVGKSAMELVLGFVGKTHALNMYGLFSITSFGAKTCFMPLRHTFGHKRFRPIALNRLYKIRKKYLETLNACYGTFHRTSRPRAFRPASKMSNR